jgi:hypothetical protein
LEKKRREKILVAVRSKDRQDISRALGAEFNVVFCDTFEKARLQLDESIGLVVCGAHFDDGRMFDLLRHLKEDVRTQLIPFLVIFGNRPEYSPAILHSIQSASEILGARGIIDFSTLSEDLGEARAFAHFRQIVRRILSSGEG